MKWIKNLESIAITKTSGKCPHCGSDTYKKYNNCVNLICLRAYAIMAIAKKRYNERSVLENKVKKIKCN